MERGVSTTDPKSTQDRVTSRIRAARVVETMPTRSLPAEAEPRLLRLERPDGPLLVLSAPLPSPVDASPVTTRFSRAEGEVVALVLRGWSSERIASETGRATRTVSNLLARACRKVGVTRRTELAHALGRQAALAAVSCTPEAVSGAAASSEPH